MTNFNRMLKNIFLYNGNSGNADEGFILDENPSEKSGAIKSEDSDDSGEAAEYKTNRTLSSSIDINLKHIKNIFGFPDNSDFIIREFVIRIGEDNVKAAVMFFDGYVDKDILDRDILHPIMVLSQFKDIDSGKSPVDYVLRQLLAHNQAELTDSQSDVVDEINSGSCAIFIDTEVRAIICDVKGWEHRTVERPNTEMVIRGPQQGFTEVVRMNTALLRNIVRDANLMAENINIGKKGKTPCAMMYIKGIVNTDLVNEVRRRLTSLNIDYITDSGELEQLIEDSSFLPAPQILASERPDRTAAMLMQGRVAIVLHGSPFVLVVPVTLFQLLHSSEDYYIRFPYGNFIRIVRHFGAVLALLLPALYIAITNFHHEMIPTELIFAIQNSREKVPFPSIIEILIMEFSFELIREAGIRIPTPIGPTLGIIGALILGQAAVAANIVSPVLIIVVAVTGIGSFAIPNFSLSFAMRILRFVFIVIAAMAGFHGITTGLVILLLWFAASKSFGVRFLSPIAPKTSDSIIDVFGRMPIWKHETRPDFLNTRRQRQQDRISRSWISKKRG